MRSHFATITTALVCFVATASAEPGETVTVVDNPAAPISLPDLVTPKAVAAEFALARVSGDEDLTSAVLTLRGQFEVSPHLVITTRLPLTYASIEDASNMDIGNLGAGARFARKSDFITVGGGLHVSLPTASDGSFDDSEDGLGNFGALFAHFDRYADFLPDSTTFSGHGDLRYDDGRVFAQAQLGLDLVDVDDETVKLARLAAAVGVRANRQLSFVGELTTVSDILEDDDGDLDDNSFLHWSRLGARYQAGKVNLGAHLYVPIDAPVDDVIGGGVDVVASF